MVFDAQLASIKGFKMAGGAIPRLEVLPLAQRYAALTASLLVLSAEYEVRASNECINVKCSTNMRDPATALALTIFEVSTWRACPSPCQLSEFDSCS